MALTHLVERGTIARMAPSFTLYKDQRGSSFTIEKPRAVVYRALLEAASEVGKIKEKSDLAAFVTIRIGGWLTFSMKTPATVRATVKHVDDARCELTIDSEALEGGLVNWNSAGSAVTSLLEALERRLT